jgi:uncharacterized membrane protein HdeD (DUF308 family)
MTVSAAQEQPRMLPWWLILIEGIVALVVGVMLLVSPVRTTIYLIQVLGWYWLISGVFEIIGIFIDHTKWGWRLFSGIIGILAGLVIIGQPLMATILVPTTMVWIVGFLGIFFGVVLLIRAFQGGGWAAGILGVLSIILGIMLIGQPFVAALALPWIFGVCAIVGGILAIVAAFRFRSAAA